jgi:hypothetical protein
MFPETGQTEPWSFLPEMDFTLRCPCRYILAADMRAEGGGVMDESLLREDVALGLPLPDSQLT